MVHGIGSLQLTLDLKLPRSYSEQNFLITTSNKLAYEYLMQWPDWSSPFIAICGEQGSGKTYLMNILAARHNGQILTFPLSYPPSPDKIVAPGRILIIDHADELRNEQWLFHIYNLTKEVSGYLVLASQRPPSYWSLKLPDLQSRLNTIPIINIQAPDDKSLQYLLNKSFKDRGLHVSEEVMDYLLRRIERSFRGVQEIVAAMDTYCLLHQKAPTLATAREVLSQIDAGYFNQEE